MTSVQIKRQAKYLCLILLLLAACRSKNPPTIDIVSSDAIQDKIEKDDIDGAIEDFEKQIADLLKLISNQSNTSQPTVDNSAQMLAQISMMTSLLEIMKAKDGDVSQKEKIDKLEKDLADAKKKLEEKDSKPNTGSPPVPKPEPEPNTGTKPDKTANLKPGSYLYLDHLKGAMVVKIKDGNATDHPNYNAKVYEDNEPFKITGYGSGAFDLPDTASIHFNFSKEDESYEEQPHVITAKILALKKDNPEQKDENGKKKVIISNALNLNDDKNLNMESE